VWQGKNSKVEYTYGWYAASAGNKLYARVISRYMRYEAISRNVSILDSNY
jgi:hypothetical protein